MRKSAFPRPGRLPKTSLGIRPASPDFPWFRRHLIRSSKVDVHPKLRPPNASGESPFDSLQGMCRRSSLPWWEFPACPPDGVHSSCALPRRSNSTFLACPTPIAVPPFQSGCFVPSKPSAIATSKSGSISSSWHRRCRRYSTPSCIWININVS